MAEASLILMQTCAVLESFRAGFIVYSFYGKIGMLIALSNVFVILLAGERHQIM